MSALPEQAPDLSERIVLAPPSGKPAPKTGPSIDSILRRMEQNKNAPSPLGHIGADERFASYERNETEFREQRREVARLQAESMERMRVAKETEILLAARERLLEQREALITARQADAHQPPSQEISALEATLRETREALKQANQGINEKEEMIADLRAEMEQILAGGAEADSIPGVTVDSYDGVTDPSLADQVAFLREREAFIEESENVLFDKAQQLQEWETRLQQMDHDQANPPPAQPEDDEGDDDASEPLQFPSASASQ